jgi:hypothetical protein
MIVAMQENAYHVISSGSFDAEMRGSGIGYPIAKWYTT